MAKKKQWFLLGALGAFVGVALKLVRGRREEQFEPNRWESGPPAPREAERPS